MAYQPTKTDTAGNTLVSAQLATLPQLAAGISASAQPHGTMRVTPDPTSIFYDSFPGSVLDITDRWNVTGTAPTQTNGVLTLPAGTASTTSVLTSKPVIPLTSTQYVLPAFGLRFEAAVGTGVGRFWGMGTAPSTPSVTSLAQEGVGFELDSTSGALQAVTYTGGVKTIIAALTRPVDGLLHRYSLQYRNSRCYWFVDDLNVFAATATFLNTAIQDLPIQVSSVSGATPTNAPTLSITAIGVADLNRQATQLSDGLFPWRKTTVKAASVPAAATDGALVVALHPSSPLPAGSSVIGAANINTANASATTALHTANATTGLVVGANLPITGYGTALLKVTGTFVASLAFKVSQDAGASWDAIAATQVGAGDIFTTATLPGSYRLTVTGFDLLRVEVTLTSGSITISGRGSNAVNASKIVKLATGANTIGTVLPYRPATPTPTSVASAITSATLLAANTARAGATIYNNSTSLLYVELGATASTAAFTVVLAAITSGVGGYYEVPFGYRGVISGIWATANGTANIRELS